MTSHRFSLPHQNLPPSAIQPGISVDFRKKELYFTFELIN